MEEEFVTTTTPAEEVVAPAPTEEHGNNLAEEEVAPATTEPGEEPEKKEPSKAVKELIKVRKRAQEAEAELEKLRAQLPKVNEPSAQETLTPPKLEDFATWDEYEAAKDEYLLARAEQRILQKQSANAQTQVQSTVEKTFQERIEIAAEENPVLLEILEDKSLPISKAMAEVIKESESSPEILLFLNGNRKEAARIAQLGPIQAAKELGKIEATLVAAPKPAPPKKVSQAPEPIKTVSGGGSPVVDEDNLPMDEWVQRRNAAQFPTKVRKP